MQPTNTNNYEDILIQQFETTRKEYVDQLHELRCKYADRLQEILREIQVMRENR